LNLRLIGGELPTLIEILAKVWRVASTMCLTFLLVDTRSLTKLDKSVMSLLAFFETVKPTSFNCVITTHIIIDEHFGNLYDMLISAYSPVRPTLVHYTYTNVPTKFINTRQINVTRDYSFCGKRKGERATPPPSTNKRGMKVNGQARITDSEKRMADTTPLCLSSCLEENCIPLAINDTRVTTTNNQLECCAKMINRSLTLTDVFKKKTEACADESNR
jgi:hypothetical protein